MNQAQLRPPRRVYQGTVAMVGIPAVVYAVFAWWWLPGLEEVQRRYFTNFVKFSVLPNTEGIISGKAKPKERVIYYTSERGEEMPAIAGMWAKARDLRPVTVEKTTAQYLAWLQTYIYRAKLWPFAARPVVLTVEILFLLFVAAWHIDRRRHLKFRSTPRHVRGSRLVDRAGFRRRVKGDASGCWTRWFAPDKVRPEGIGWRTEDYQEER